MRDYIFYTMEGYTVAPDGDTDVENCQVLGYSSGKNIECAQQNLIHDNPWIEQHGFDITNAMSLQVISDELKQDILRLVEYMWSNEEADYEISGKPIDHIFRTILKVKNAVLPPTASQVAI